jgi:hypothetical protein
VFRLIPELGYHLEYRFIQGNLTFDVVLGNPCPNGHGPVVEVDVLELEVDQLRTAHASAHERQPYRLQVIRAGIQDCSDFLQCEGSPNLRRLVVSQG